MTAYLSVGIHLDDTSRPTVTVCDLDDKGRRLTAVTAYSEQGNASIHADDPGSMRAWLLAALDSLDRQAPPVDVVEDFAEAYAAHQQAFLDRLATPEENRAGLAAAKQTLR